MWQLNCVLVLFSAFCVISAQNTTLLPYENNGVATIPAVCIQKYGEVDDFKDQVRKIKALRKLSETVQCLLTCSLAEEGFIGKDHKVDEQAVIGHFMSMNEDKNLTELVIQAVKTCKSQENPEDSECMTGARFIRCMLLKKFEILKPDSNSSA